jgi:porin
MSRRRAGRWALSVAVAVVLAVAIGAAPGLAEDRPALWISAPPGIPGPEYRVAGVPSPELPARPVGIESWERLSGNWGGWRDRLRATGVEILGDYITEIAGNATGGMSRGVTYTHNVGLWINTDLDKVLGWRGALFHVSGSDRAGSSLSLERIGNQFAVQQIFGGQTIRLINLALEQKLGGRLIDVIAGRIDWGDDFAQSPLYCKFQNVGFCGNPVSIPIDVAVSTYPNTAWGARLRLEPNDALIVKLGVYNSFRDFRANEFHGVDFSMRHNSGVVFAWETSLRLNHEEGSSGLPGHYKIGGWVDTEPLKQFRSGDMRSGTNGFYLAIDQMLFREKGVDSDEGLTGFVSTTYAPPELALIEFYVIAGLLYQGLIPGRDHDVTGAGMIYGGYSSDLRQAQRASGQPPQELELVFELNYGFAVFPWLRVQPDLQYVVRPGGTGNIPDALVVALQVDVPI